MSNVETNNVNECPCGEVFTTYKQLWTHVRKKKTAVCDTMRCLGRPCARPKSKEQIQERNRVYKARFKARQKQERAEFESLEQTEIDFYEKEICERFTEMLKDQDFASCKAGK